MPKLSMWVCCGGHLGEVTLKELAKNPNWQFKMIWTDKSSLGIIDWAKQSRIPFRIGKPQKVFSSKNKPKVDVLLSINYLFLFPKSVLVSVPLAVNIHGALLPKYRGRTPNTWVIINDEVETGITVHEMVEEVDAGDILYQERLMIGNADTAGSLMQQMSRRYPIILNKVLKNIVEGTIKRQPQNHQKHSYFGKREPEDGLIDWRWSSRKVYNWVRALTKPYPGAFFFHKGRKYILWWVDEYQNFKDFSFKKIGIPFFKGKDMFIRCAVGGVKVIEYEIIKEL